MPIYIYRCKDCDHEFEIRQRMTEEPLTLCPVCQGEIRRVVNSVGVVFKGKGFYVTDNRSGQSAMLPGAKQEKAEKSAAAEGGGSESSSSSGESKPSSESSPKETKAEKAPTTAV